MEVKDLIENLIMETNLKELELLCKILQAWVFLKQCLRQDTLCIHIQDLSKLEFYHRKPEWKVKKLSNLSMKRGKT
jgi:hypothetical protein